MTKENDPHRLCTSCHGKTCSLDDGCEECHDLSDERCQHVGECMAKLLVQREKKHERIAKASSSSFSGCFSCSACPPVSVVISFRFRYCDDYPFVVSERGDLLDICSCHLRCPICCTVGCYVRGAGPQAASLGTRNELKCLQLSRIFELSSSVLLLVRIHCWFRLLLLCPCQPPWSQLPSHRL